ncbi:MAG TPA: tripartite tricarboxylate transporter permease [Sphaerochaeta sp.]|jgi:putative tricarboxylic transport membrane protein|nr:tripartite tricarboxylate transporter permease [Sphaerochaeta sp.]HPZ16029.1 tripartite tricarboxylate transporter permease [Sphaerochaeta sp.]
MDLVLSGLGILYNWQLLLAIPIGMILGIIVGAIPGLTSDLGIILMIPLTYTLEPTVAILALVSIYVGGTYGGSITAILINTPGTSANAASLFDGYPMAQKGEAYKALSMALYASTIGGLIGAFVLLFLAPPIAKVTLKFGPAEYLALAVFGLSVIAGVSNENIFKGLIGACIGIFVSTIGLDVISGTVRFTFGNIQLRRGIDLIIALIGLFAISEILMKAKYNPKTDRTVVDASSITKMKITKEEYKRCRKPITIGTIIGVIIGATPGTGGGLAAFIAYNQVKQTSSHPETFGKGEIEGVAASESANNAACGGTMIPMLTLGVPGDGATAILMGAFMVHGLVPGPMLFKEQGSILYAIMIGSIIVNICLWVFGKFFTRFYAHITRIPFELLACIVLTFCAAGAFSTNNNIYDVYYIFIFGILAYYLRLMNFQMVPILLGIVLGPLAEMNFRRALILSDGSYMIFIKRPISLAFLLIAFGSVVTFTIKDFRHKRREAAKSA